LRLGLLQRGHTGLPMINRLHTMYALHRTFLLSHALHNALNTIYPPTTASSSSPISLRSTSQSLHPS